MQRIIKCHYVQAFVRAGRSRTRCPKCGAELQKTGEFHVAVEAVTCPDCFGRHPGHERRYEGTETCPTCGGVGIIPKEKSHE